MKIRPEKQTTYGWFVAIDIFLTGMGGGVFFISYILNLLHKYEPVARIGSLLGPLLALMGTFFLLAELGRKTRFIILFTGSFNPLSWLSRGAWILSSFIVLGLAYSLALFEPFEWLPWSRGSGVWQGIGIAGAVLSILVVMYPGFLFGVVRSVPFWNTPVLPIVFLFSGLCTGIASLFVTAFFFKGRAGVVGFPYLGTAGATLVVILLLVLGAYLEIARHQNLVTLGSLYLLRTPFIICGAMICGLLLPAALFIVSIFVKDAATISIMIGIGGIFLLSGGLFLEYGIISAGTYRPVR